MIINRTGVARAVLQTPLLPTDWVTNNFPQNLQDTFIPKFINLPNMGYASPEELDNAALLLRNF